MASLYIKLARGSKPFTYWCLSKIADIFDDESFRFVFSNEKFLNANLNHYLNKWLHSLLTDTHVTRPWWLNTLRLRQNGRHFADDMFKCIFLNENVWIPIEISLKFVPKGPINNIPALVQIMAWRRSGDKPLSEPMMVGLPTHTCVTRPQWVNILRPEQVGWHFADDILKGILLKYAICVLFFLL